MKKVSSAAIAAAVVVGLGGLAVSSPAGAKKEEAPKGPVLSAAVRTPALAAQTELGLPTPDLAKAEASIAAAEAAAKTDDEHYIVATRRLQLASKQIKAMPAGQQSDAPLAKPLDDLIANPKTPRDKVPLFMNYRAQVFYNAKQFAQAATTWSKARELGYTDVDLLLNIARAKAVLPADAEAYQMLRDAKAAIAADKPLATQEKLAAAAPKGDLASQTGDAYLGAGNLAKAIEMYKLAVSKGQIDLDPVNLHLGIALALSGNKAEAQTAFAAVKTSPNSDIANLWTPWLVSPPAA